MENLAGSEMVVRCLQEEGVEVVFGLPGGTVIRSTTLFTT